MNSIRSSLLSLMQVIDGKVKQFDEIHNANMVWVEEIQQEAKRMFSRDFKAEPELMPKTPSQKKNSRRKRVSIGHQEENRRRFSKGRRSNLRGSVKSLNFIATEDNVFEPSTSTITAAATAQPKRTTRKNMQSVSEVVEDESQSHDSCNTEEVPNKKPELVEFLLTKMNIVEDEVDAQCSTAQSPPKIPSPEIVVSISSSDRLSAEHGRNMLPSPGRTAAKIAIAGTSRSSRRSSKRCSLKLRHSVAGLRHSMTQESVRRASRRSMMKRKVSRMANSTCSSNADEGTNTSEEEEREPIPETVEMEDDDAAKEQKETPQVQINQNILPAVGRITRSVAANTAKPTVSTPKKTTVAEKQQSGRKSRQSIKRKAPDTVEESPTKRHSPPKKSQSAIKPNMRSFLQTVQKNRLLMETPNSLGRTAVIKSFIKHTTPLKIDEKTKERNKLEALKRKQELEEERMKKMEDEKKRKQDELKRKRDERLRRVYEAKVKEEQKDLEKKKKIEQKMAQIDEMKNDKRLAEEKAKKKAVTKRQEELEQRKKLQQAEEEKRQQELLAKKKAEEEEQRARKLAEARRALELEREQERERLAAAERERVEREKALALQRELERAAREKERRELEEKRKALEKKKLEEQQRLAAEEKAAKEREAAAAAAATAAAAEAAAAKKKTVLNVTVDIEHSLMSTPDRKGAGPNVTVDIEKSPQSYSITPKGGNKPPSKNGEDYGMDQNSDDSTDDESAPRKPIPSWAEGHNLQQLIMKQYFNPPDLDCFFGPIEPPKLENIFYKSKPRYYKRTSSAVWNSPPNASK